MADWFEQPEAEVLAGLDSGRQGIDSGQAEQRLKEYGENVLEEAGRLQWWQVFLAQFKDLLVIILIGAAAVSMLTGDPESAMVIFAVLLLNAVLGTVQHQKAEKSLDSLKRLSSPEARVLRDGRSMTIPSALVVPGDILLLETGDMVAADGRLLEVYGLTVNESSLTGESLGVEKHTGAVKAREGTVALADRTNMVFSGSLVTSGRAVAAVTATGMNTEIGKIAVLMNGTKEQKTPLQVSLDRFSGHLAIAIIAICGLVFLLSLYRREPVLDALMFAVALAVAAIPEALSSIVTIVQAMGTQKMAREQAIIKDLKAVESLGCVSVICSDKTGTLTKGEFKVTKLYPSGISEEELLELAALAENYSNHPIAASIKDAYANEIDINRLGETEEISGHGVKTVIDGKAVLAGNGKLMEQAGIPYQECKEAGTVIYVAREGVFAGSVLISDTIKEESFEAIRRLKAVGVRKTVMLTGDRKEVGEAVAKEIGLDGVYTELLPGDKVDKVEMLLEPLDEKRKLAFVGDGINDAPVLTRADIGIAMGSMGSDAAIEAADVVLMDDNPAKIATVVKIARKTLKIVKQNIVFALAVKALVLILGAAGMANMWEAVFADVGVSVIAILNAMRALKTED